MSCKPKICAGNLRNAITIERRTLDNAAPGSAEPVHTYAVVFAARAEIKTKSGVSEFNRVEINGLRVSHAITIRHTSIAFDIRDRVRDAAGNLYTILAVENVDERDDWLKLHCAGQGSDERASAL